MEVPWVDLAGSASNSGVCRYWGTNDGCKRGDRCKFTHSPLAPKDNRCFGCSAEGHSKKDCPHVKKKVARLRAGENPKKGLEEPPNGLVGEDRVDNKEPPPKPPGLRDENLGTAGSSASSGGEPLDALVQEAAALMKSLRPKIKAVGLSRATAGEIVTGLLDGGATNALRQGSAEEIARSMEVNVELATGTVKLYQCVETGTLLSPNKVEPIVPLRGLVALGYKIRWDDRGCLIFHPQRGRIRCWLRNGCPVVVESHALGLINDIEDHERFKRMGPRLAAGRVSDVDVSWWKDRFPLIPEGVLNFMVGQDSPPNDGTSLPWNRRKRRRVMKAKAVIIHLFAGDEGSCREWEKGWPPGVEVLAVDTASDARMNLHHPAVWGFLCHVARTCPVAAVVGGPPCRTVSRMRLIQPGPPPLRGRSLEERFGLEGLEKSQQLKTDSDSALVLKQVGLRKLAMEGRGEDYPLVGFLLESPRDPAEYTDLVDAPTFWTWPELQDLLREWGMQMITFDQGGCGHCQVKPTSCLTNLPTMENLQGLRAPPNHGSALKPDLEERMKQSAEWSKWAPRLKQEIRRSLLMILKGFGCDDGSLKAMKAMSREQWIQHFQQGHRPFRRDCRTCVLDMGTGKPHRRRHAAGTSSWAMGIDLVQFPKAVDETTGTLVRYAMIATLLVPLFKDEESPGQEEDTSWGEGLSEKELGLDPGEEEREEMVPPDAVVQDDPPQENPKERDWDREIEACSKPLKVKHLTVVHLLESRATPEVIHGLNSVTTQFRAMGLVVDRMHSDKARELVSRPVQKWLAEKGMWQSTTGGDDAASAGHVESEVNQLKRRTRFYLRKAGLDVESWPIALRFSAEERKRVQLEALGTPTLEMLPFFSQVMVKRKRWHDRGHLAPPFVNACLLGPSPWMHHGWTVKTEDSQILHVREAIVPCEISESVALQLQEEDQQPRELEEIGPPEKPPWRLFGKQSKPLPFHGPRVSLPDSVGHGRHEQPPKSQYSPSIAPAEDAGGEIGKGEELPVLELEEGFGLGNENARNGNGGNGNEKMESLTVEEDLLLEFGDSSSCRANQGTVEVESENVGRKRGLKLLTADQETVGNECRVLKSDLVGCVLSKEHEDVLGALEGSLRRVPLDSTEGSWCGDEIRLLLEKREGLERSLRELHDCERDDRLRVCGLAVEEGSPPLDEVLQTTVVSLDEVRNNVEEWKQAMVNEYLSLTQETRAIEPVDLDSLNDEEVEYVPGKLVCTLKAGPNGGRKKCRGVICGNLVDQSVDPAPWGSYASGADGLLIRASIKHGVEQGWGITTTDVKTAFLLAPRPKPEGAREVIVVPPKIMVMAGVCKPRERWRVHRALYGFPSSPARWSAHRDSVLRTSEWEMDNQKFVLKSTPEGNLWKIIRNPDTEAECVGHVLIYVDDVMAIAPETVRDGFLGRLKKEWAVSNRNCE